MLFFKYFLSLRIIIYLVSTFLLLAACTNTSNHSSAPHQSKDQQNEIDRSKSNTTVSSGNDSSAQADSSDSNVLNQRKNANINEALNYERAIEHTTVDKKTKTMVQSGKKVGFSIVPNENHQNDFKEGSVKEVINNSNESHQVTLFTYQIDSADTLTFTETATNKVIYTKEIK